EEPLRGYLTRGAGPEAPWEFRFAEAVAGLEPGAVLRLAGHEERWRVESVGPVQLDGQALAWSARVERLGQQPAEAAPPDLAQLLAAAQELLEKSTLASLEREDVEEALKRLPGLAARRGEPGAAERVAQRLRLLRDRFQSCPQTGHAARGLILRLEAAFKRLEQE
ncbi:MAG TPA: hypothetical protein VNZ67_02930, partial [bacterium]|nr:hypothetical protein [bacterium]